MSKKEILKYLLEINTDMSVKEILFCLCFAFLLGLVIYGVYKYTYSGTVYSQEFNVSLILMVVITTSIMIVIGSNLALSLGLVGSLSIVRFRSAVKENRDLIFIFWAISAGLACGAEVFSVGLLSTIVIALILICMSRRIDSRSYIIVVSGENLNIERIEKEIQMHSKRTKLRMHSLGELNEEVTFEIMLKKNVKPMELVKASKYDPKIRVNMVSNNGEMIG